MIVRLIFLAIMISLGCERAVPNERVERGVEAFPAEGSRPNESSGSLETLRARGDLTDLWIHESFVKYFVADELLARTSGARVIQDRNGSIVLIGVAATELKNNSEKERQRAESVCQIKAIANIVKEKNGAVVTHIESLRDESRISQKNGDEEGQSETELLQLTQAVSHGKVKNVSVVGRWKSKDRKVLFVAVGGILNSKGLPIRESH